MSDSLFIGICFAAISIMMLSHNHEKRHGCDLTLDIVGSSIVVLHEGAE